MIGFFSLDVLRQPFHEECFQSLPVSCSVDGRSAGETLFQSKSQSSPFEKNMLIWTRQVEIFDKRHGSVGRTPVLALFLMWTANVFQKFNRRSCKKSIFWRRGIENDTAHYGVSHTSIPVISGMSCTSTLIKFIRSFDITTCVVVIRRVSNCSFP